MNFSKRFPFPMILFFCFACVFLLSAASSIARFDEELHESSLLDIGTSLACELVKCVKGQCVNSSSFPFYRCECDEGWATLFGRSWLPCILPNCSIDLTCDNTSSTSPAPPPTPPPTIGSSDICTYPVCGNGVCLKNSTANNSLDDYECKCNPGYMNLMNQSDGYCIRGCSLGANCANLGLPIGGSTPPPPPSVSGNISSSNSNVNQGRMNEIQNWLLIVAALAFPVVWT